MHVKAVVKASQVTLTAYDLLSNHQRSKAAGRSVGLAELEGQISALFEWSFRSVIRAPRGEQTSFLESVKRTVQRPKAGPSLCVSPACESELIPCEITRPLTEMQLQTSISPERKLAVLQDISHNSSSEDLPATLCLPGTVFQPKTPQMNPLHKLPAASQQLRSARMRDQRASPFPTAAAMLLKPSGFVDASKKARNSEGTRRSQSQTKTRAGPGTLRRIAALVSTYSPTRVRTGPKKVLK